MAKEEIWTMSFNVVNLKCRSGCCSAKYVYLLLCNKAFEIETHVKFKKLVETLLTKSLNPYQRYTKRCAFHKIAV